jgi:hypothetical protein
LNPAQPRDFTRKIPSFLCAFLANKEESKHWNTTSLIALIAAKSSQSIFLTENQ